MVRQNKKFLQNTNQARKRDIMSRDDTTLEAKVVQEELNELHEELNTTVLNEEDEMASKFNHEEQKEVQTAKAEGDNVMRKENAAFVTEAVHDGLNEIQEKSNPTFQQDAVDAILKGFECLKEKVVYVSLDTITENPKYVNKLSRQQIKKHAKYIQKEGFRLPIITDWEGRVIVGNSRFMAAKQLKLATIPTIDLFNLTYREIDHYFIYANRFANKYGIISGTIEVDIEEIIIFIANASGIAELAGQVEEECSSVIKNEKMERKNNGN